MGGSQSGYDSTTNPATCFCPQCTVESLWTTARGGLKCRATVLVKLPGRMSKTCLLHCLPCQKSGCTTASPATPARRPGACGAHSAPGPQCLYSRSQGRHGWQGRACVHSERAQTHAPSNSQNWLHCRWIVAVLTGAAYPQPMWRFKQYLVAASHVAPGAGPTRNRNITSFRYNGARWHAIQAWPKAIAQNGNLFNPDVREDGCRV